MKNKLNIFFGLYELWIASRYIRHRNRDSFISFISFTSIIGITLGVMALIVVLSVMNGFQNELKSKILSVASDVEVTGMAYVLRDWQTVQKQLSKIENIKASAPFTQNQSMIALGKFNRGVMVRGVDPTLEPNVSSIQNKMYRGSYNLISDEYEILIGIDLARYFSLKVGDKLAMISSQANFSALGALPRIKQFKIKGIFNAGMHEYDSGLVIVHIKDAQNFFQFGENISGLRVKLNDLSKTQQAVSDIEKIINIKNQFFVFDWTRKHTNLFAAIQMEKRVMFIILTLIIAVAAFNIVATLVMGVAQKRSDIAILRTIGALPRSILLIFIFQGFMIGLIGTFMGIILGIVISINIDVIVPFIESLFGVQFLSKDIYYISQIPSQLLTSDVISIGLMGLLLSLLATLYPSYKASKIDPASALKHE